MFSGDGGLSDVLAMVLGSALHIVYASCSTFLQTLFPCSSAYVYFPVVGNEVSCVLYDCRNVDTSITLLFLM